MEVIETPGTSCCQSHAFQNPRWSPSSQMHSKNHTSQACKSLMKAVSTGEILQCLVCVTCIPGWHHTTWPMQEIKVDCACKWKPATPLYVTCIGTIWKTSRVLLHCCVLLQQYCPLGIFLVCYCGVPKYIVAAAALLQHCAELCWDTGFCATSLCRSTS